MTTSLALAARGAAEGTVAARGAADRRARTAGQGVGSPPGNLYASTLVRLRPGDPPAPTLALVAAVALHEVAAGLSPPDAGSRSNGRTTCSLDGAKLAGILLERADDAVVVGFGVNLAHHPTRPRSPRHQPRRPRRRAPDPATFLEALAEAFARWLAAGASEGSRRCAARWLAARPSARHRACRRVPDGSASMACSTASTRRRAPPALGGRRDACHPRRRRVPDLKEDANDAARRRCREHQCRLRAASRAERSARAGGSRPIRGGPPTNMRSGCTS